MLVEEIKASVARTGIRLSDRQLALLTAHAQMVLAENAVRNLTRIVEPCDVAVLHVADSLTAVPFLVDSPAGTFADIGSGAGYPAIPLAVVTERPFVMVESRGGKAEFLRTTVAKLGLDGEVAAVRAEELAAGTPEAFAAVTARAVAALPALVELASPLLIPGGRLIAMKGDIGAEELERGDAVAALAGMERREATPVVLPGNDAHRTIVVYERAGRPRVRLPRRPGMAQRNPLA